MGLEERRKREKESRRQAILRSARKLFFDKGFKSVTVELIARKAELSKGSVYLHFRSKEEIYSQILLNDIAAFQKKISTLLQSGESPTGMLIQFSRIYIDFFLNDRELFRILMAFMLSTDQMNLPAQMHDHIVKATNRQVEIMEGILKLGIERGQFSATMNLRRNRNAIWGLLNGIISLHLFTGREENREGIIRATIDESIHTFLKGLGCSPSDEQKKEV